MQYLYTKNYKRVLGEQKKEDINKWRAIPCSWIGILNIVKIDLGSGPWPCQGIPNSLPSSLLLTLAHPLNFSLNVTSLTNGSLDKLTTSRHLSTPFLHIRTQGEETIHLHCCWQMCWWSLFYSLSDGEREGNQCF